MDLSQKEAREGVERRIRDLIEQYVELERLEATTARYGRELPPEALLEEDLGMDFVDLLYFLADLEAAFRVPMELRTIVRLQTLGDAFDLAWAQRDDLWLEPDIGGEG